MSVTAGAGLPIGWKLVFTIWLSVSVKESVYSTFVVAAEKTQNRSVNEQAFTTLTSASRLSFRKLFRADA